MHLQKLLENRNIISWLDDVNGYNLATFWTRFNNVKFCNEMPKLEINEISGKACKFGCSGSWSLKISETENRYSNNVRRRVTKWNYNCKITSHDMNIWSDAERMLLLVTTLNVAIVLYFKLIENNNISRKILYWMNQYAGSKSSILFTTFKLLLSEWYLESFPYLYGLK